MQMPKPACNMLLMLLMLQPLSEHVDAALNATNTTAGQAATPAATGDTAFSANFEPIVVSSLILLFALYLLIRFVRKHYREMAALEARNHDDMTVQTDLSGDEDCDPKLSSRFERMIPSTINASNVTMATHDEESVVPSVNLHGKDDSA
jgi:hypothetical protein